MEIDAELRRQIVVAVSAGIVFLAAIFAIGTTFNGDGGLPEEGALAIVALLVGFVLLMAGVGFYLDHKRD